VRNALRELAPSSVAQCLVGGLAFVGVLLALAVIGALGPGWLELAASLLLIAGIATGLVVVVRRRERQEAAQRERGA
jgi:hypothetical protein